MSNNYKDIILSLHNLFQLLEAKGQLSNSFSEASITQIPTSGKDITRKEIYGPITPLNIDTKFLNKISANKIQQCLKRNTP